MANHGIDLNFFSNIVHRDPKQIPIFETIASVDKTFGLGSFSCIRVYLHPHPFDTSEEEYTRRLHDFFAKKGLKVEVTRTKSLWDGYIKSVEAASAPYALQMEHDWQFLRRRIKHSANDIVSAMEREDLPYLRFNKRKNGIVTGMILKVSERTSGDFSYCSDNVMSNNPHFIRTSFYKQVAVPLLKQQQGTGSLGIERELTSSIARGATYGLLGYPQTIKHLNGKKIFLKSKMNIREKIEYRLARLKKFREKYL